MLLAALSLRRTKDRKVDGKPLLILPPKTVSVQTVHLSAKERQVYDRWGGGADVHV